MDKYKFGEFIYQKRKILSITQDELGRKLGVTNKAVSKWETGETLPEITMLEPLANALNISIEELLKQQDFKEIDRKKVKINILLLIFLIFMVIGEIITICAFTIKKKETINLNIENIENYISIDSLKNFEINNQKLIITQSYLLNKEYAALEDIHLSVNYVINFYYYKEDNSIGIVTFYNRIQDIVISDNVLKAEVIEAVPKNEIPLFKGISKVEITYELTQVSGSIERR